MHNGNEAEINNLLKLLKNKPLFKAAGSRGEFEILGKYHSKIYNADFVILWDPKTKRFAIAKLSDISPV